MRKNEALKLKPGDKVREKPNKHNPLYATVYTVREVFPSGKLRVEGQAEVRKSPQGGKAYPWETRSARYSVQMEGLMPRHVDAWDPEAYEQDYAAAAEGSAANARRVAEQKRETNAARARLAELGVDIPHHHATVTFTLPELVDLLEAQR